MTEKPQVQSLGDHNYVIHVQEGEDTFEIRVHASPAMIARLTTGETDETRIIQATAAYLIARQRADDLPPQLDLDDVAAAYEGFEEDLRRQLADDEKMSTRAGVERHDR